MISNSTISDSGSPTALITGASSGIGRSVALELATRGYRLILAARRTDELEALRAEIEEAGGTALVVRCDVTQAPEVRALVDRSVDAWGRLDAVVHSAGVEFVGDVLSVGEREWRECIDINLTAAYLVAHHTVPHLLAQPSSAFVAIGSDSSVHGAQGYTPYAVAKHGVIGLVRCMAVDYGHRGLRTNAVCPTNVETPMIDRIYAGVADDERRFWEHSLPMMRFARAQEVAKAVAHLVGPESSYTNGMVYNLDGGSTSGYFYPHVALETDYPRVPSK
ncbi:SDR family NAD(P)-dependent oxidoreductase [Rhodococcus wratislaviensis]|uniref:SDR family NAD(P)-dependent oxidoreductase n=1 Tax=Rhodococcus wratislaviensis TaxID=44752 RepID=UPI00364C5DD8